ncbi:hypothetical protein MLD38_015941 [Melastoma candidum]|uniref:Uncharacterized protein n=1 Tax=Melastoma candidum TaxID=119954 RepID=A0ACB9RHY5_9MYRT|nr:hypothetical protein MLD38_015941 [Melastoma candidum]
MTRELGTRFLLDRALPQEKFAIRELRDLLRCQLRFQALIESMPKLERIAGDDAANGRRNFHIYRNCSRFCRKVGLPAFPLPLHEAKNQRHDYIEIMKQSASEEVPSIPPRLIFGDAEGKSALPLEDQEASLRIPPEEIWVSRRLSFASKSL